MAKLGKEFELVVADVVAEMDLNSTVRQGEWMEGPDGERELDVIVEVGVDGVVRRIQIECRDYSPHGRPIGIGHIDALDSKHRDLKMDVSLLCSNAGFSTDAIRKAKRLGIGLVGVLRESDPRIRYQVVDEIYVRRIDIVPNSANINFDYVGCAPPQGNTEVQDITYEGAPVFNWLLNRIPIFLGSNPIINGIHSLRFRFKEPLKVALRSGTANLKAIRLQFEISGNWIAQRVEIDATSGLYDWIRRTIRLGPGPATVKYKDVKFGVGGVPIKCPPDFDVSKLRKPAEGEVSMWILDLGGLDIPKDVPQLDKFVMDEDLEPVQHDLAPECYVSKAKAG